MLELQGEIDIIFLINLLGITDINRLKKCTVLCSHFDHQYLWKKSIDLSDFLHGNNPQSKVASETTTFG